MHGTVVWARGGPAPAEAALLEALGLTVPAAAFSPSTGTVA
jgi:hypothetical protein